MAVPVVNSLTLIFTLIGGFVLGEKLSRSENSAVGLTAGNLLGLALIAVGVLLCLMGNKAD